MECIYLDIGFDLSLQGFQVTHDIHIVGAEQIGGLCDLLHAAVQSIDAAGKKVDDTAGQPLVDIFHIQNDGLLLSQLVSGLGGIVEGSGMEENDLLFAGVHIQNLTAKACVVADTAGEAGIAAGREGRGTACGCCAFLLRLFFKALKTFLVFIIFLFGIRLCKFLNVIPNTLKDAMLISGESM